MANENINKVIYGGNVLIDLTGDDVNINDVLVGKKFHLPNGALASGECTYDADTKDATANAAEILDTKTAYKNGSKLVGTMPNIGEAVGTISSKDEQYSIAQGYHDGSGKVSIAAAEQSKIIATNIRQGITILGVLGSMSGSEDVKATSASVTPYTTSQEITPQQLGDYNSITQINVAAIAYSEIDNEFGGKTATIGTVAPT